MTVVSTKVGEIKAIIIGESSVGKTSLLNVLENGKLVGDIKATVSIDSHTKEVQVNGKKFKLRIYDTAGQERFRSMVSSYYRDVNGIIIVFDVTDRKTFDQVQYWMDEIKKNTQVYTYIVLVGNKSDLDSNRVVTTTEAQEKAQSYKIPYYETSATLGTNVQLLFDEFSKNTVLECSKKGIQLDPSGRASVSQKQGNSDGGCC
ncbi:Rab family GTPase [Entamoeba histolytica HM-1:IMSS-B]|uniref:Rab family GTPase n=5 Tax=Entamoeba histolytica TaxID=5759 RepID=A0A8U0WPK7_ENTH1|eukprot:XP_656866.1 Rab family GTPase [Entamoeba histolytica HM-1:IMSS]